MAKTSGPDDTTSNLGKAALARLLGWSRPTLDLRLETDPAFPVLRSGSKGGGWRFDAEAVRAYLQRDGGTLQSSAEPDAGDATSATTRTAGEQSARQRRDAIQADILQDQLSRNRGELVQAELMRQVLSTMLAHLGQGLARLPDQIVERLGVSEERADDIRQMIDELRKAMVAELDVLFIRPTR
jgi:phage terminase Nu1 subunit (DNA packaging protein)